jgi:hypothetical protein
MARHRCRTAGPDLHHRKPAERIGGGEEKLANIVLNATTDLSREVGFTG